MIPSIAYIEAPEMNESIFAVKIINFWKYRNFVVLTV